MALAPAAPAPPVPLSGILDKLTRRPGRSLACSPPSPATEPDVTAGTRRWCNPLLQEHLGPGGRVLTHAGPVVQVLSADHADEIENAFAELASQDPAIGLQPGQEWERVENGSLAVGGARG
jgi:hypothetical protein